MASAARVLLCALVLVSVCASARADAPLARAGLGLPVRVHLDETNLSAETAAYDDAVRAALDFWASGGNGDLTEDVTFTEVPLADLADLRIEFVPLGELHLDCLTNADALGCARTLADGSAAVQIALRDRNDELLPAWKVRHGAIHVLGHALGLRHSVLPYDVMHPYVPDEPARVERMGQTRTFVWGPIGLVLVASALALPVLTVRQLSARRAERRRRAAARATEAEPCPASPTRRHDAGPCAPDGGGGWRRKTPLCRYCGHELKPR